MVLSQCYCVAAHIRMQILDMLSYFYLHSDAIIIHLSHSIAKYIHRCITLMKQIAKVYVYEQLLKYLYVRICMVNNYAA